MNKVILFISDLQPGGAQKQIIELSKVLADTYEVYLFTWTSHKTEYFDIPSKVKRVFIGTYEESSWFFPGVLKKIIRTRILVGRIKPIATISFLHEINFWNILSSFGRNKINKIISVREHPAQNIVNLRYKIYKFFSKYADFLVCQNEEIKNWLEANSYQNVVVVPNFLNLSSNSQLNLPEKRPQRYILAVGTKVFQKGFDQLLEAYKIIVSEGINTPLVIVGIGNIEEREKLNLKIGEENLDTSLISIIGFTKDMNSWYNEALIFVLSSRFEGTPNALVEAMKFRLPIVAYDCHTGPKELLQNGEFGILVPENDVRQFAQAMKSLIIDSKFRSHYSRSLSKLNSDNSLDVKQQWMSLINFTKRA